MTAPPRATVFKKTVLSLFLHNEDKKMYSIVPGFESSFTNACGDEIQLLATYKLDIQSKEIIRFLFYSEQ